MNRGRERACSHDIHGTRKTELAHHLPVRVEQEREERPRVVVERLERSLDPWLRDVSSHARMLNDSSMATRILPMCARGSASVTSTSPSRPIAQMCPFSASSWRKPIVLSPAAAEHKRALR